jgi:peptidoglycan/LPS O-acetylase OafA/YrhL
VTSSIFQVWKEDNRLLTLIKYFLLNHHFGVNVFFVVSGFLITSLLLDEEQRTGTISFKNFYIRRTLRIFPAYYFVLLVYFFLQLVGYFHLSALSWMTSLTFTKQFYSYDWQTGHFWSLSVEEMFYLFWPMVFVGGDRFRKRMAIVLIILAPLMRIVFHFYPTEWRNDLTLFTRIDGIALGCFVALYKDEILAKLSSYWTVIFISASATLLVLPDVPFHLAKIGLGFVLIPLGVTYGSIANVLIALILLYSVFGPQGLWFRLLNSEAMNYVGMLSYSIYLWQQFFIWGREGHEDWIHQFPQNIVLTFLAAMGSYYLIEKPFLRMKAKFPSDAAPTRKVVEAANAHG